MSLPTLTKRPLALPLTDTVMLACQRCQPEIGHRGTEYLTVTHVRTGRQIVTACCLRGAWEAARHLAHPREFRWTAKRDTLAKKQDVVRRFVLDATGVEMFHEYECAWCSA